MQVASLRKIKLGEMENFVLILEVMTYESREEKRAVPSRERRVGRSLMVAVAPEAVWSQTPPPSRRHRDSLLGWKKATVKGINC